MVALGTYSESGLAAPAGAHIWGGYNPLTWAAVPGVHSTLNGGPVALRFQGPGALASLGRWQINAAPATLPGQSSLAVVADSLAHLVVADAVLVALFTTSAPGLLTRAFGRGASGLDALAGVMTLGLLAAVGGSIFFAFLTVKPRLEPSPRRSMFYFKHIAEKPTGQFIKDFLALSDEEALEDLLAQVHANSQIARAKFRHVALSTYAFVTALALWIVLLVLQMMA